MNPISRRTVLLMAGSATAAALATSPHAAAVAPSATAQDRRPSIPPLTIDLGDYCVGDGTTNDAWGLQRALDVLERNGGGTLTVPAQTYLIQPRGWISIPEHVAIVGAGAGPRFVLSAPNRSSYTLLFRADSDNVVLENVTMVRGNDVYGGFLGCFAGRVWLHNVRMYGRIDRWDNDFSGVRIATIGRSISGLTFSSTSITRCGYGVYLSEAESNSISDILVDAFEGTENAADDLEFCAPLGWLSRITVTNSKFANNRSNSAGWGFAVGIANASDVTVSDCTFVNYAANAVHIEHKSSNIRVSNCSFTNVSTRETGAGYASAIIVLSASRSVRIDGNYFDLSQQTNDVNAVYVGPGGTAWASPAGVTVDGNTAKLRGSQQLLVNYGTEAAALASNSIVAA